MKPGDLVMLQGRGNMSSIELYESDITERFHTGEVALVLETCHQFIGDYTYYKILTPRAISGWVHELQLRSVYETR